MARPSEVNSSPAQQYTELNDPSSSSMDVSDLIGSDIWATRPVVLESVPESSYADDIFEVGGDGASHADSDSDTSVSSTSSYNSDGSADIA